MFRVPLYVALALIIAFGGGIATTLYALNASSGFGAIKLGAWEAFPRAQTADADPYAKSHRARAGKLLLGTAEGLKFTATQDDGGQPLRSSCRYRITGQTPPARLWTLYVADRGGNAPIARDGLPAGLNSWVIGRQPDSSFVISVAADAQSGNWLPLPGDDRAVTLALTLFDTPTAGSSGLIDLSMPQLQRIGCGHA
ncbi:MAG: DUF1214 domain-containing protein [Rhizobiales bacterium]|nr:DUF1214 domain-containing protein [Hyphomicrobiales bacterium]